MLNQKLYEQPYGQLLRATVRRKRLSYFGLISNRIPRTLKTSVLTSTLPTFKIKIMGSETQNYRISRKIIVHKFLVHILPADGASLLQI